MCPSDRFTTDTGDQVQALASILSSSWMLRDALSRARSLDVTHYYIGAGCIVQTVWNHLFDNPLDYGIKDIDFVYFDDAQLDYASENEVIEKVKRLYVDIPIEIDVKNQARVHLWYESRFGYEIAPYRSLEAAIDSWPTTATAIGVRKHADGRLSVYAPFGLNDLFGKIVRANKAQITRHIYDEKVKNWLNKWPELTIIPWDK